MKRTHYLFAAVLLNYSLATFAAGGHGQDSMKEVILAAMNSASGTSQAVLVGPLADNIRAQIQKQDAKIVARASVIGPLPQEGCNIVEVAFTTPGTKLRTQAGDLRELDMRMKFNACKNGTLLARDEIR